MKEQTKSTSKSFSKNVDEYGNKQILSHYSTKDQIILSFCMYQLLHPDNLINLIQMKHLSVFHISKIKFYLGLGLNRIFLFKMVVILMAFNFFWTENFYKLLLNSFLLSQCILLMIYTMVCEECNIFYFNLSYPSSRSKNITYLKNIAYNIFWLSPLKSYLRK